MNALKFLIIFFFLLIGGTHPSVIEKVEGKAVNTMQLSIFTDETFEYCATLSETWSQYLLKKDLHAFQRSNLETTQHVAMKVLTLKLPPIVRRKIFYLRI